LAGTGWKGAVALIVAVLLLVAQWVLFGFGFGSFTEGVYTLGSAATTLGLLCGSAWGRNREEQERTATQS
jgi:hypothetical protein